MPKLISALVAGFLFTGSAVLAGCGTATLHPDDLKNSIKSNVEQQAEAQVSSVDCPGAVKAEKGKSFTCEATAEDGTKVTIKVTQTDDKGNVQLGLPRFIHTRSAEQLIAKSIRNQTGRRATVDCSDLVVAKRGVRFTCSSRSGGKNRNVAVRVDNAQGHISWGNVGG